MKYKHEITWQFIIIPGFVIIFHVSVLWFDSYDCVSSHSNQRIQTQDPLTISVLSIFTWPNVVVLFSWNIPTRAFDIPQIQAHKTDNSGYIWRQHSSIEQISLSSILVPDCLRCSFSNIKAHLVPWCNDSSWILAPAWPDGRLTAAVKGLLEHLVSHRTSLRWRPYVSHTKSGCGFWVIPPVAMKERTVIIIVVFGGNCGSCPAYRRVIDLEPGLTISQEAGRSATSDCIEVQTRP